MTVEEFWKEKHVLSIHERIKNKNLSVVLPEGEDDRVIESLKYIYDIKIILLGNKDVISRKIENIHKNHQKIFKFVSIIEPKNFLRMDLVDLFIKKRNGKISREEAEKLILQPNYFATLLLEVNEVSAVVGGCVYSTAEILKPAFQIIKQAPGNSIVSSCFLMKKGEEELILADCAVNINPTKEQLIEITNQTIQTTKEFSIKPKVALLSYSTKGSGIGKDVDFMREVSKELIEKNQDFNMFVDGELQFDAAYVPKVAKIKAPDSLVGGQANVFIFPNITTGNIAYKIMQYTGGYEAIGPLIQGLNKPVNDLSRGTDAQTIAKVIYLVLRKY